MKKLILLSVDEYVRNYLTTNAFEKIMDDECWFMCDYGVGMHYKIEHEKFLGYYQLEAARVRWHYLLIESHMLRHFNRSRTFVFRYLRYWDVFFQKCQKTRSIIRLGQRIIDFFHLLRVAFVAIPGICWINKQLFELFTRPCLKVEAVIQEMEPDIVIVPSIAIDSLSTDVCKLRSIYNFKVLLLVDNWDNLSSKSVFPYKPDYISSWGPQSTKHAMDIHKFPRERIFELGTPRFGVYYETLKEIDNGAPPPPKYDFPYILFVGCSLEFDELSCLRALDAIIRRINDDRAQKDPEGKRKPLKVVYRPHPKYLPRRVTFRFNEEEFTHVILDRQIANAYNQAKGMFIMPPMGYYPSLFHHAEFVIGPLTTMLIEASIMRKQVLALAYDDGIHWTSPHRVRFWYKHFEGCEKLGWRYCTDPNFLPWDVQECLNVTEVRAQTGEFVYQPQTTYAEELAKVVDMIQ